MSTTKRFVHIKEWGNLTIFDVLVSYIYPRVFVCEDEYESRYLFYEMSSNETKDVWLVSKITKHEYYDIVDKKRTIQSIYNKAPSRNRFVITKEYGEKELDYLSSNWDEWYHLLPKDDVYAETKESKIEKNETLIMARRTGNTIFDIKLYPNSERHDVPQNILLTLCEAFTSLTNSLKGKRLGESFRIATAPGSCIIRFRFDDQINLMDESSVADEVEILNDTFSKDDIENRIDTIKDRKGYIQSYTKLFETIKKIGTDIQISSAFPNSIEPQTIDLSKEKVLEKYGQIKALYKKKTSEVKSEGQLVALDIKNKRFKFIDNENDIGKLFSGEVNSTVFQNRSFEIPGTYYATIQMTEELDRSDYSLSTSHWKNPCSVVLILLR